MAEIVFREAREEDFEFLARGMRMEDAHEVRAFGYEPEPALRLGAAASTHLRVIEIDGAPACMFGITPLSIIGGRGCPWLLGTDDVWRHRRALMRLAAGYIPRMLRAYPHLMNYVHAENVKAVRWLRHAGFTLAPAAPQGPYGELFHLFEMRG